MSLKRITYISQLSDGLTREEVEQIGAVSRRNNSRDGLTGLLAVFRNHFYQVLEGEVSVVEEAYERILADSRHRNLHCLKVEEDAPRRLFPEWDMQTLFLDEREDDPQAAALRSVIETLEFHDSMLRLYAPRKVLESIERGVNPRNLLAQAVERTVLFADVLSFTTFTERLAPREVMDILDHFYFTFTTRIEERGGEIMSMQGDGLAAYFPGDRTADALEACLDALRDLEGQRLMMAEAGSYLGLLYSGIGIATGRVIEANIGSDSRKDYTLLGDTVNVAARIEGVTRKVGRAIILTESAAQQVQDRFAVRKVGKYVPKGKTEYVALYTVDDPVVNEMPDSAELRRKILELESEAAVAVD